MTERGHHAAAGALLLVMAVAETWPLARHLDSALPGAGAGDNLTFLWNLWWMRHVGAHPSSFLHSDYLLWPFGADLVLHTHTLLNGLLAATLLERLSLIEAQNVLILASVFLNAMSAYLLAYDITRSRGGSILAATIFGGAPYFAAHLEGHFNLLVAWPILVWIFCARRAARSSRASDAAVAGLALALVAYADYYYFVFSAVAACLLVVDGRGVRLEVGRRMPRTALTRVLSLVAVLLGLLIAWIHFSGGTVLHVGGVNVLMRTTFNPRLILWATLIVLALLRWRCTLRTDPAEPGGTRIRARSVAVFAVVFGAAIVPLAVPALSMIRSGDYSAPGLNFRSAPAGVDLVALVAGNPRHPLWGESARRFQDRININPIEGVGWLGVVPVALGWLGLRRWPDRRERRSWGLVLAVFLIWALGPFLMVWGWNTALVLPQTALRILPVVSNARMPGRAMVMVYLSLAMLSAMGLAARPARAWWTAWALVALTVFDYASAPIPLFRAEVPTVYEALRARADGGALLELPMGIRDGFGSHGAMDPGSPLFQTIHEHPVVGGFLARMPARIVNGYLNDEVFGPLLRASEPGAQAVTSLQPTTLREGLRVRGVRYVVLRRSTASGRMVKDVEDAFGPDPLARDADRELFEVRPN